MGRQKVALTNWGPVMWCIYASVNLTELVQTMAWRRSSHYINQCWTIVNCTLRNKLHSNLNRNSYIFSPENSFENIVTKIAVILSRPQWVKTIHYSKIWCLKIYDATLYDMVREVAVVYNFRMNTHFSLYAKMRSGFSLQNTMSLRST